MPDRALLTALLSVCAQSLNLRGNQLVGWHPLLDPLVQLRDLDLSGNRLRGPGIPDGNTNLSNP